MGHEPGPEWRSKRNKPMVYCWTCLQCCTLLLGLIMTIVSQASIKMPYNERMANLSLPPVGDVSSSTQIYLDWTLPPFVDISVAGQGEQCPSGSEPVFSRRWGGLEEGCFFDSWFGQDEVVGVSDLAPNERKRCNRWTMTEPHPPITQTTLGELTICGQRGGDPFKTVTRPNSANQCPSGTSACSTNTRAENTVCYPDSEKSKCPITGITFEPTTASTDPSLTSVPLTDEFNLVFSKTADSLPITTTQLALQQPCVLPD